MSEDRLEEFLSQQLSYYRERASEYDEWWLRRGRYDRGPELNQRWFTEAEELVKALRGFDPKGRVLELACGTGLWTRQLAHFARHVTAVDAAPEMLSIARQRAGEVNVSYILADVFSWHPDALYDVVFFSFWLSHVPPERFAQFWHFVRSCLAPNGRVFFIDSVYSDSSGAVDSPSTERSAVTTERLLGDGRQFTVVKVFYAAHELEDKLAELGWAIAVRQTQSYFLYGHGTPMTEAMRTR